ncbi:MAG: flagellar biosynthesis anti-sigma factor FlgM [Aquificaceae bacterium]
MIDRIDIQRILGYIVEAEENKRSKVQEKRDEEGVKVELSKELKNFQRVDYEDIEKRVESIKKQLQKGTYEVSPEKILTGLEKYIFAK